MTGLLPTTVSCSGPTDSGPRVVPVALAGHYEGGINVVIEDTIAICFPNLGCQVPALESIGCKLITDLTATAQGTFTGTFAVLPNEGGPGGSGLCDLPHTQWLTISPAGLIQSGTLTPVPTGNGAALADITFRVGQGTHLDLESLLGCTAIDTTLMWYMTGSIGDTLAFGHFYRPASLLGFTAAPVYQPPRVDVLGYWTCRGRKVHLLRLDFSGDR